MVIPSTRFHLLGFLHFSRNRRLEDEKEEEAAVGAAEKQQRLSEEYDRRWRSGKELGDLGSREARLSGQTVLCLVFSCVAVLLRLGLELFPEGPLQLRHR